MKIVSKALAIAAFTALAACNSGTEADENVMDAAENEADALMEDAANQAEALENQAENVMESAENQADALEANTAE